MKHRVKSSVFDGRMFLFIMIFQEPEIIFHGLPGSWQNSIFTLSMTKLYTLYKLQLHCTSFILKSKGSSQFFVMTVNNELIIDQYVYILLNNMHLFYWFICIYLYCETEVEYRFEIKITFFKELLPLDLTVHKNCTCPNSNYYIYSMHVRKL